MIISKFNAKFLGSVSIVILLLSIVSMAQDKPNSRVIFNKQNKPMNVAERNNVYCAGYIQTSPINTNFKVVGADDEADQFIYAQGDYLYVNQGAANGAKVGDVFSVVRPRGQVKSKLSKKGKLGFYVQEVGAVEIVRVREKVSLAKVKTSCDNFLLGDLLQPMETRVAPMYSDRPALDMFAEANGKTVGKIVMARDSRESLSREQIVYIDLGAEDSVRVGDYLTVFRPLGKKISGAPQDETMKTKDYEYGSEAFQGGPFSNSAPRKEGGTAEGNTVTTSKAKASRPAGLRKVVGEMVILSVKERTATAMITRNKQEIHTGDWVEVQ